MREDICVLFELFKAHNSTVNLSQAFDSFVNIELQRSDRNLSEPELIELQGRFVQAASELKLLGLCTEARPNKTVKDVLLEQKVIARSTTTN
jgi:hypothetical protein